MLSTVDTTPMNSTSITDLGGGQKGTLPGVTPGKSLPWSKVFGWAPMRFQAGVELGEKETEPQTL